MNVLLLDSIEPHTYGGMEEWIRMVAGGLARRGHQITVASRPGSELLERVASEKNAVALLPLEISGDFDPGTIAHLKRYISDHDINLITVNFNKDVRLGGIAARLEGRPRVIWSVGLDITKDNLVHKLLTPRLVDGVIVPSEALKRQITRHGYIARETVTVIPIGIPDKASASSRAEAAGALRLKYGLTEDALVAVTSARFVEQKGHRFLIEAAPMIIPHAPSIRFLWLGDGPLQQTLQQTITAANLDPHFVFAGMLRESDLELAGADLMIHPSIEEPFGIVLLEAMRAGLPVVASNAGGIPEVVDEGTTALLCPPRDPKALADTVVSLLRDQVRRDSMGRAGRERFEGCFQYIHMIDRIEQYFASHVKTSRCTNGTA